MVLLITHLNKLGCQFERRTLKAKVVSGGVGQDEPKVDVDDVSLRVQENVAIVSVCVRVCVCVCMHVSMSVCVAHDDVYMRYTLAQLLYCTM